MNRVRHIDICVLKLVSSKILLICGEIVKDKVGERGKGNVVVLMFTEIIARKVHISCINITVSKLTVRNYCSYSFVSNDLGYVNNEVAYPHKSLIIVRENVIGEKRRQVGC